MITAEDVMVVGALYSNHNTSTSEVINAVRVEGLRTKGNSPTTEDVRLAKHCKEIMSTKSGCKL